MSIERVTQLFEKILAFENNGILSATYNDDYMIKGKKFFYEDTVTFTGAETKYFLLNNEKCKNSIIFAPITAAAITEKIIITIYEDTNYTGGTPLLFLNYNRNFPDRYNPVITVGATGSSVGNKMRTFQVPALSTGVNSRPFVRISDVALILKCDKNYLVKIVSVNTTEVDLKVDFFDIDGGV